MIALVVVFVVAVGFGGLVAYARANAGDSLDTFVGENVEVSD